MKSKKNKTTVKKNSVSLAIIATSAVLNILTLFFTVVAGTLQFLSGSESYYSNGFTLAFIGYPEAVEGVGAWLRVYSVIHFLLALSLVFVMLVFVLVKRSLKLGAFGLFSVIYSLVLSALYFAHGIIAYSAAADYAGLYYECRTASFVPFIIMAILATAYFVVKFKMPDEIELG